MKKTLFILISILVLIPLIAISTSIKPDEYVTFMGFDVLDSLGTTHHRPDSVHIFVFRDGVLRFDDWYHHSDAQADSTLVGNTLSFFDQLQDIDGGLTNTGQWQVNAWFYEKDSVLWHKVTKWYEVGMKATVDDIFSIVPAAIDTLMYWAGWGVDVKSRTIYGSDSDRVFIWPPTGDSLWYINFIHLGGNAGQAPDSTRNTVAP